MYSVSNESKELLKDNKLKKREIVSQFPIDLPNCECGQLIQRKKQEITLKGNDGKMITCPRNRKGYKQYEIFCKKCKAKVAEVFARNKKLEDWFDLHYYSWHDKKNWHGAVGLNISPIDQSVGFECACGNDARDFRANQTMRGKQLADKINETVDGREWGKRNSKFKLKLKEV